MSTLRAYPKVKKVWGKKNMTFIYFWGAAAFDEELQKQRQQLVEIAWQAAEDLGPRKERRLQGCKDMQRHTMICKDYIYIQLTFGAVICQCRSQ